MSLDKTSIDYMSNTPLGYRKRYGQYMTPSEISDIVFQHVNLKKGDRVLDPAVGTGELLLASKRRSNGLELYGWDVDQNILNIASNSVPEASVRLQSVHDSIPEKYNDYFDFIIGNPPYFELKKDEYNTKLFTAAGGGRTNIYSLFFEKYLPLLKPNGIMAYIVPPSMNAGAYFTNLRKFIILNTTIKHLQIVRANSHFTDALTSVQIIILQKTVDPNPYKNDFIVNFNTITKNTNLPIIFTENKKLIIQSWKNNHNLYDYGYEVLTGSIAWNEHKNNLSSAKNSENSILYHAKDIVNNSICISDKLFDKRYIKTDKPSLSGDMLLVNRIVGSLDNPKLKIAKVSGKKFYAENHVNVIRQRDNVTPKINIDELYKRLTNDASLSKYIQALTGNTQISAKELMFLIPV